MQINQDTLVEMKHLHEDIAGHFCDDAQISGETYWECIATLAEIKLMELRGQVVLTD